LCADLKSIAEISYPNAIKMLCADADSAAAVVVAAVAVDA
jgi:hypothetical protein